MSVRFVTQMPCPSGSLTRNYQMTSQAQARQTFTRYPVYSDIISTIDEKLPEKEQVTRLREVLAYMKVCGINAAKVYVKYREEEEDWKKQVACNSENTLLKISREMQNIMKVITSCEKLDRGRNDVLTRARQNATNAEITPGTLEHHALQRGLISDQLIPLQSNIKQTHDSYDFSRATVTPFSDMWKECMQLIEPEGEFDLQNFIGDDDPVFSVTILATNCPISREPYRDVVRTRCNHRFNRSSIEGYFRLEEAQKCPVSACRATIRRGQWEADPDYEQKLKISERRRREQTQKNQEDIATLA